MFMTGARGVGLIDALSVVVSDNVFVSWTYITESPSAVDAADTASSTVGLATEC
jgi:Na+/H+ antiporter NhaB